MNYQKALIEEFKQRVFAESYERIYRCLSLINDDDLWMSPSKNLPTVGNLVLHLCGNARQWILSGLGEATDNRDREAEFVIHKNIKKSDLIFLMENLKTNLNEVLDHIPEHRIHDYTHIQGFKTTGFSAIVHVIEHFSYHTGQITTLTKWITNKETGYYSGLDLNQLNNLN